MAKTLIFSLAAERLAGLSITTHRGSSISLFPGESTTMPLGEDEPMTLDELITYYNARYLPLGLKTTYTSDSTDNTDTADKNVTVAEPIKEFPENVVHQEEPTEATENETPAEETAEGEAPESEDPETWDFNKMKDFVKDNDISVKGKGKSDYLAAIKKFLEK